MGAKGWGAYPVDAVPAGTFVADYAGEVLPVHEAKRRVPAYDRDGLNYVLTTQEFFQGVRPAFTLCVVSWIRKLSQLEWALRLVSGSLARGDAMSRSRL